MSCSYSQSYNNNYFFNNNRNNNNNDNNNDNYELMVQSFIWFIRTYIKVFKHVI